MQDAAPAELQRIAVGYLGQGFDRLGRVEHLQGPQGRVVGIEIEPGLVAMTGGGRDQSRGALGNVRGEGFETQHRLRPQARRQPVDQAAEGLLAGRLAFQPLLGRRQDLGPGHGHPHLVEAESGVQRGGQGRHPLAEQPQDRGGVAGRTAGADDDPARLAVHAIEAGLEGAAAQARLIQPVHGLDQQVGQNPLGVLGRRDGLEEDAVDDHGGGRAMRGDAHVLVAQNPRQSGGKVAAEAGGQGSARPVVQIAQPLQAQTAQGLVLLVR